MSLEWIIRMAILSFCYLSMKLRGNCGVSQRPKMGLSEPNLAFKTLQTTPVLLLLSSICPSQFGFALPSRSVGRSFHIQPARRNWLSSPSSGWRRWSRSTHSGFQCFFICIRSDQIFENILQMSLTLTLKILKSDFGSQNIVISSYSFYCLRKFAKQKSRKICLRLNLLIKWENFTNFI